MRNLILSAFPRNMRLPDPFLPNLKVDLLPEIHESPSIIADTTKELDKAGNGIKQYIERFVNDSNHSLDDNFYNDITDLLLLKDFTVPTDGTYKCKYNVPLINSLVLFIGTRSIEKINLNNSGVLIDGSIDVFVHLVNKVDAEGRYYILNAIANQLRYPNNHTHFFSCVLLVLFADAPQNELKEQITRVLLERLIVHRPHPWGLLITFIELIKNPRYDFWSHKFTRCAPEIERLFQSVARSCVRQETDTDDIRQEPDGDQQPARGGDI